MALSIAGLAPEGCGGGTASSAPQDSGSPDTNVVDSTAAADVVPEDADAEGCAVSVDLETVSLPDAGLPDDASVGTCLPCVRTTCGGDLMTCNADCACKTALLAFFSCVEGGKGVTGCAGGVIGEPNALALGSCVLAMCADACGTANLGKPRDAGADAEDHLDGQSAADSDSAGD